MLSLESIAPNIQKDLTVTISCPLDLHNSIFQTEFIYPDP